MWISKREWESTQEALTYWRTQYEKERERADRLTNNLLMTNGLPPASAIERPVPPPDHEAAREMLKGLAEMMREETDEPIPEEKVD